eukprot:CAMPEP_0179144212 /NCGR_PEP_ID=MMETSP0796-20121207/69454_1 /TAXON_ID=73915 /ORGANISM="Pyrodinium bahamense, Strain pbaha01" /LENGTH=115 /DNA_ID=CAMNT_0020844397 /DNA_START=48 /DNA_END=396 /DNA_ORIENTATION=-
MKQQDDLQLGVPRPPVPAARSNLSGGHVPHWREFHRLELDHVALDAHDTEPHVRREENLILVHKLRAMCDSSRCIMRCLAIYRQRALNLELDVPTEWAGGRRRGEGRPDKFFAHL